VSTAALSLAVLEHALLVLPLPFTALWGAWLRHTRPEAAPTMVGLCDHAKADHGEKRRHDAVSTTWPHEKSFNLTPAESAI
jgi:hypothetical protein